MSAPNLDHSAPSVGNGIEKSHATIEICAETLETRIVLPENECPEHIAFDQRPTVGFLDTPTPRTHDHLETLVQWGDIPKILAIPEAVSFIATRCKQNPAAIQKVLTTAILGNEIEYWALSHNGGWTKGIIRILFRSHAKKTDQHVHIETCISNGGRVHIEAMGVNPRDVVGLLARRNRKVPAVLRDLMPDNVVMPDTAPEVRPVQRQIAHDESVLRAIKSLNHNALALPKQQQGKPGIKSKAKAILKEKGMSDSVFKHAWDRLLATEQIKYLD